MFASLNESVLSRNNENGQPTTGPTHKKKVVRIFDGLQSVQPDDYPMVATDRNGRMAALKAAMRVDADLIIIDCTPQEEKADLLSHSAFGFDILIG